MMVCYTLWLEQECWGVWWGPVGLGPTNENLPQPPKSLGSALHRLDFTLLSFMTNPPINWHSPSTPPATRCLPHESLRRSNPASEVLLSDFKRLPSCCCEAVGKHPGIRRICGTNSCPLVSAGRAATRFSTDSSRTICYRGIHAFSRITETLHFGRF